ncbi:MAG: NAD(P)-dependent oxidoreductase, partial [Acidobacteriota bacterium]
TVSRTPPPRVRTVLHLAANIDTARDADALRVNDVGTGHLLDWLAPVLRGARVVYTSSVAAVDRQAPAKGPLTEASPCTPRTPYGLTKLRGEAIVKARAADAGYTYTILRLATIYGPGAKPGGLFDSLLTLTTTSRLLGRINWPGRCSVMHVDDVARCLTAVGSVPEAVNETYCTAAEAPTVSELAQRIAVAAGHPVDVVALPPWIWSATRALTWNPLVRAACGAVAPTLFWRFSLLIDDGFWMDGARLNALLEMAPVSLDAGLVSMLSKVATVAQQLL